MRYPAWHNQEDFQNLKEAMTEQARNNIILDGDRREALIVENADIINDIWLNFHLQSVKTVLDSDREGLFTELGMQIAELMDRKIDYLAEADVEDQLS